MAGLLLAVNLAACTAAPAPKAVAPSVTAFSAPTPTPTPVIGLSLNYLDQTGSHYIVWVDVSNHGAAIATGQPLISLYFKELSIGQLCGPSVSVPPGETRRVKFERLNGPAALFDHEDVAFVPSC